jgi:hypothetical protein
MGSLQKNERPYKKTAAEKCLEAELSADSVIDDRADFPICL